MTQQAPIVKADTLWGKYRIDEAGDTVTPVLVKYAPTAFDSFKPCDISLLAVGDTRSASAIVGTIKPNVCAGYSPTMSERCTDTADVIMFAFTVFAMLKLLYKVAFWPKVVG